MKKVLFSIIIIILIFLLGFGIVFRNKKSETIFNTNYINGNTAGNLYNNGLFCEFNDKVFFANPDDHNKLYVMDLDGGNIKKLANDSASFINADSHYVYYIKNTQTSTTEYAIDSLYSYSQNNLCRIDWNGENKLVLDDSPCFYASLIGNYIYYLHYDKKNASTLYRVKIDGSEKAQVANKQFFTCSASDQYFFFNDMVTTGNICRFDTATNTYETVYECNSYKPIVSSDGNAYYLDINKNNALVHANIKLGSPTILTIDSIDHYNVYGSFIYYQSYSPKGNSLNMIRNDGSNAKKILEGDFCNINITSYFIYFTDFHTGQVYFTPTSNPGEIYNFHPGIEK